MLEPLAVADTVYAFRNLALGGMILYVCRVLLAANYLLLEYARYEGHSDSSYPAESRSMLTTRKDRTNSAEVIHLLTRYCGS
jgi:hypothetical protein